MKNSSQCLTLLDDLDYFALDSISDDILYRSIKVSLEAVGKTYAKAVVEMLDAFLETLSRLRSFFLSEQRGLKLTLS